MQSSRTQSFLRGALERLLLVLGAGVLALACFIVLPLIQAVTHRDAADLLVQSLDTGELPPPPPPLVEEEPPPEPEAEEPPPELEANAQPLDLAQLELALNSAVGFGSLGMELMGKLDVSMIVNSGSDTLFNSADLDQAPRAVYQPSPVMDDAMRKAAPGTVKIVFVVDPSGRVESPTVLSSSDPIFERAAINAVKQWRFEPGRRNGQSVSFRMRVPITFPKS